MKRLSLCSFRTVRNIALGTALAAVAVVPTFAAGTVTVTGTPVSIVANPTIADFTGVTLSGAASYTSTSTLSTYEVDDLSGAGAGWHVTAQASQFAEYDTTTSAYVASGKTIPASSLTLAVATVSPVTGTTSASPTITGGTLDSTAIKVASAAAGAGMGKYTISSAGLSLTLPSAVYARTYKSDLTISVTTAP